MHSLWELGAKKFDVAAVKYSENLNINIVNSRYKTQGTEQIGSYIEVVLMSGIKFVDLEGWQTKQIGSYIGSWPYLPNDYNLSLKVKKLTRVFWVVAALSWGHSGYNIDLKC